MNFVQLLFELQLGNENFSKYSDSDFIKFEKHIKAEKKINTEITTEVSEELLHIIKNHSNNLEALLSKKNLTNVFLEKEPILNNGSITKDSLSIQPEFKEFFSTYLENDLNHIIKRKIAKKDYKYLGIDLKKKLLILDNNIHYK